MKFASIHARVRTLSLLLLCGCCAPINPASAQSTVETEPGSPEAATPEGYRWGSFLARPEAGVSLV
ncbi:MAG TPA: hypothetical protein VIR60_00885, partial [Gammaproteobacteria bacterium]